MNHEARTNVPCAVRRPRIRRVLGFCSSRMARSATRSWSVVTPSSRAVSRRRASVRSRSRWSVRTSTFQGESASHGPGMNSFLPESGRITVMWRFQVAASIEISSSIGRPRFANSSGADQSSDSPTILSISLRCSMQVTRNPLRARWMAAAIPERPAPMTTASVSITRGFLSDSGIATRQNGMNCKQPSNLRQAAWPRQMYRQL